MEGALVVVMGAAVVVSLVVSWALVVAFVVSAAAAAVSAVGAAVVSSVGSAEGLSWLTVDDEEDGCGAAVEFIEGDAETVLDSAD